MKKLLIATVILAAMFTVVFINYPFVTVTHDEQSVDFTMSDKIMMHGFNIEFRWNR